MGDQGQLNSSVRSSFKNSALFRAEAPAVPGPGGGGVGDQGPSSQGGVQHKDLLRSARSW